MAPAPSELPMYQIRVGIQRTTCYHHLERGALALICISGKFFITKTPERKIILEVLLMTNITVRDFSPSCALGWEENLCRHLTERRLPDETKIKGSCRCCRWSAESSIINVEPSKPLGWLSFNHLSSH